MNIRSLERGATMWSMITIAVLVVLFALLLMKIIPPYLSDLKIKSALDSIARQGQSSSMSNREILIALEKRFDIDSVTHVNVREDVTIERRGRAKVIVIEYEALVPLIFNISALLEFNHSAEVPVLE